MRVGLQSTVYGPPKTEDRRPKTAASRASPFRQCRLRSGEPCDGNPVRRAADVIEADLLEKVDGRGVAAVLAADAQLQILPSGASPGHGRLDKLTDTDGVDRGERILLHD